MRVALKGRALNRFNSTFPLNFNPNTSKYFPINVSRETFIDPLVLSFSFL